MLNAQGVGPNAMLLSAAKANRATAPDIVETMGTATAADQNGMEITKAMITMIVIVIEPLLFHMTRRLRVPEANVGMKWGTE